MFKKVYVEVIGVIPEPRSESDVQLLTATFEFLTPSSQTRLSREQKDKAIKQWKNVYPNCQVQQLTVHQLPPSNAV